MRSTMLRAGLLFVLSAGGAGFATGCATKTEGERTMEKAERHEAAGLTIRRGELLIRDGKAMEARGDEAKRQGDTVEGDRMIAEGRSKQAQGEELIREGRKMKP